MLLVGNYNCIPKNINNLVVYNLFSLREDLDKLYLSPDIKFCKDDKEFDRLYANEILTNDIKFLEFMKIIYPLYEGKNVYLVTSRDEFFDNLTESLLKLIQQRYGYNYNIINSLNDYNFIENDLESEFSIIGLKNLDQDKERLSYILANTNR